MTFQRAEGRERGKIVLYALSTCMWCRMTKQLLKEQGVAYAFVDVDLLDSSEKEEARREVRRWNPSGSYPTLVIDDCTVVSGYDEAEIRQKLA